MLAKCRNDADRVQADIVNIQAGYMQIYILVVL
jgi:hypothetical protein